MKKQKMEIVIDVMIGEVYKAFQKYGNIKTNVVKILLQFQRLVYSIVSTNNKLIIGSYLIYFLK